MTTTSFSTLFLYAYGLFICLTLMSLSSCATPTPYGPLTDGFGYSDTQLNDNRFEVRYKGNASTPQEQVESMWLRRAAELASSKGYAYFVVEGATTSVGEQNLLIAPGSSSTTVKTIGFNQGPIAPTYEATSSYKPPVRRNVRRYSRSGQVVGYKEGTQPANAFKASLILDKYK